MLRRLLDVLENSDRRNIKRLRPVFSALSHFLFAPDIRTHGPPHVRDVNDIKRCMILVVMALLPCTLWGIWNCGVQDYIYRNNDPTLVQTYFLATKSWTGFFSFACAHFFPIFKNGIGIFLPLLLLSYTVGGFWEALFACVRREAISEGFLVSGILFALILPPSIPYWMAIVGISAGIVIGKEVFGGTGMNILNPALVSRCFLFFAFPARMTGDVFATAQLKATADGVSTASPLSLFNIDLAIKRIHIDAIAYHFHQKPTLSKTLAAKLKQWGELTTAADWQHFITAPLAEGGLGLSTELYSNALAFTKLKYGFGGWTDTNFFFGNMIGSIGETSTFACLLGAFLLVYTGVGAWRTMMSVAVGAYLTALLFRWSSHFFGLWAPAKFDFPSYKHLLLGGLCFGLVFMATDPVSSPERKMAKWLYGLLIGLVVMLIRLINPAFPEGVMLAILFANVFAPLFDRFALHMLRRKRYVKST